LSHFPPIQTPRASLALPEILPCAAHAGLFPIPSPMEPPPRSQLLRSMSLLHSICLHRRLVTWLVSTGMKPGVSKLPLCRLQPANVNCRVGVTLSDLHQPKSDYSFRGNSYSRIIGCFWKWTIFYVTIWTGLIDLGKCRLAPAVTLLGRAHLSPHL